MKRSVMPQYSLKLHQTWAQNMAKPNSRTLWSQKYG